jgi:hypothetical protein
MALAKRDINGGKNDGLQMDTTVHITIVYADSRLIATATVSYRTKYKASFPFARGMRFVAAS